MLTMKQSEVLNLPRPEPSAGIAAYRRERELALAFDPRRLENFNKYLAYRRGAPVEHLPIKLDIENVSRCNFHCTMCQVSDWPKNQRAADMPLTAFQQLIDELYSLVEIKIQGMGEPTLQGDDYFAMIRHARKSHIWVRTVTNASLLHLRGNYQKLIDADPNEVQISIDGATQDVFEGIRRGSVFKQVLENCKQINAYCRERKVERTKMWTVVQQANSHQLMDLIDLADELGFTSMVLSIDMTDWGQARWRDRNDQVKTDDIFTPELGAKLLEHGAKLGVKVAFWNIAEKFDWRQPESVCMWPFERAYVSSDLRVVPCCMIANPAVADLGDAERFVDTWRSTLFHEFRQDHLEGRIPDYCKSCYLKGEHWEQ